MPLAKGQVFIGFFEYCVGRDTGVIDIGIAFSLGDDQPGNAQYFFRGIHEVDTGKIRLRRTVESGEHLPGHRFQDRHEKLRDAGLF